MTWPQIVLLAYFACSALLTVGYIGKRREPITPKSAVVTVVLIAGLCALVVLS